MTFAEEGLTMARLTRAQQQERTRAAVVSAAREEFAEHGYAAAKVDRIAERAELTRGAVYSNFPGKRALYLAVLVDADTDADADADNAGPSGVTGPAEPLEPAEALAAFTRCWLDRLPLTGDHQPRGRPRTRSLSGVLDDETGQAWLAQVIRLEALLLGLALESSEVEHGAPPGGAPLRRVRLAELVLTALTGTERLGEVAPGFGDPFDVIRACEHLASLDLADAWEPPHLPYIEPASLRAVAEREAWDGPDTLPDLVGGGRVELAADGVLVALGIGRLQAAEEAVRGAGPADQVTLVVVTADPEEAGRLVRLRIGDLVGCLRRAFPPRARTRVRLVVDDGSVAAALGLTEADDAVETAVRITEGQIVARADGRGAAHAAASAPATSSTGG